MCEAPQKSEQDLVMCWRTTLLLREVFSILYFCKIQSTVKSSDLSLEVTAIQTISCEIAVLCCFPLCHVPGSFSGNVLSRSSPGLCSISHQQSQAFKLNPLTKFLEPSYFFFPEHQWLSLTFCNNVTLPGIMPEVSAWLAII